MPAYLQLVLGGLIPFGVACIFRAAAASLASKRFHPEDCASWALPAITYNASLQVAAVLLALWIDHTLPGRLDPALFAEGLVIVSAAALVGSFTDASPFPFHGSRPRSHVACTALKAGFLTPWAYLLTGTRVNLLGLQALHLFLFLAGGGAALTWLRNRSICDPRGRPR